MDFNEIKGMTPEDGGMGNDPMMMSSADTGGFGFDDEKQSDDFGFGDEPTPGEPEETHEGFGFGPAQQTPTSGFSPGGAGYAATTGDTSFFGFFGKGIKMAMLNGDAAEEVAGDPKAFLPALVIYLLPSVLVGVLLFLLLNVFAGAATSSSEMQNLPPQMAMVLPFLQKISLGLLIFPALIALVGSLIWVGVLYIFAKIFKGEGSFLDYYQTIGVGSLISWGGIIPYIGILFSLWMIPVLVVVTSRVHNISTGRSVAVVLIPIVLMFVVVLALLSSVFMAMMGGMGQMQGM